MSYENIDIEAFKEKIDTMPDAVILDVRAETELNEGYIPNHTMIDFNQPDFASKVQELDTEKTYLVYCRSGNRSERACQLMESLGFEKLYNLKGGIQAWNKSQA